MLQLRNRLARAWKRLRRHGGRRGVILLYHRIVELAGDPQCLAVRPSVFRAQLEALAGQFEVVPLAELPARLAGAPGGRPLAAITCDDGYADNLEQALPVLQRLGLPATVFAASGFLDGRREFFWDDLERLILLPPRALPAQVEFSDGAAACRLDLAGCEATPADPAWNATLPPRTGRQRTYLRLCAACSERDHAARLRLLDALRAAVGGDQAPRASHRSLDAAGLVRLDASGVVRVGNHTRHHLRLSLHPPALQEEEMRTGREELAGILGRPVEELAYPFGTLLDHAPETRALAARTGHRLACSNHPDWAWRGSDTSALPRWIVRDQPADELLADLRRLLS